VLTRLSALVSHRIRADTGIADLASLNLFGGIIGPSGIGKSSGVAVAGRLMPAPSGLDIRDGLPIGSGEGLAEVFMGIVEEETGEIRKGRGGTETPVTVQVRKQVRHHAFFYIDEGASLTRLMKERSGSTLGETLRSAAVGQTLGQTNASKDTTRYIPGGSYSMGMLVGFQPETVAPLFEEVAEGTPQRYVWVQVIDPAIPDEQPAWPGELNLWRNAAIAAPGDEASGPILVTFEKSIKAELRAADLARSRGHVSPVAQSPFDSQAPVMKVKLASLLAILAGRRHVNTEDWQLAQTLWQASCATRDAVINYTEAQRRLEQEKRTHARIEEEVRVDHAKQLAENARADRAVERLALRLALRTREEGQLTRREVRDRTAGRDKRYLPDAFAYAVLREWVAEKDGKFVPGPVSPP
jgi:ABC-type dipeptide/oligopeptide/nickel transport system ATPase component